MIGASVYMLCAVTSASCAILLWLKYRKMKLRLLFWSSLCFAGLAANNALLFVDLIVVPQIDLSSVRALPALVGLALLVWGFISDAD